MASELHPWRFELEIFQSRLPCGHPYRLQIQSSEIKRCRGTTSTFGCCPVSDITARPLTVSSRGISHSKWRWFWKVQLTVFSDLFAKINTLQPNRSPEKVLNKWVIDCFFFSNVSTDLYVVFKRAGAILYPKTAFLGPLKTAIHYFFARLP